MAEVELVIFDCGGVSPTACVVVENSPTGVSAAVAVGMTVIGYTASTPAARLLDAGAHRGLDSMAELPFHQTYSNLLKPIQS